jgi:glycosyltransferase involved in cell wall biosynthesis
MMFCETISGGVEMRILLTADPFIPVPPKLYGGIERVIDALVRGLRAAGDEVGLLAHADSTCMADQRFDWSQTDPHSAMAHLRCARDLRHAFRTFKPELVHSFSRLVYLVANLPIMGPMLMSYQREPSVRSVRMASLLAGSKLQFTGCSEYIARQGRRCGGTWGAIHNFVESEKFQFAPVVADNAPLVFLSRVESIKGADTAISIARGSERQLIIAGNAPEQGHEGDWFRNQVMPWVDGNQIRYIGPVDDVQKNALLGTAAALLVPIRWEEPFGIVFAEALACGTPVISCARGALPEIVEHGRHGFLISDVQAGINAVARLREISRIACRERALSHFSELAVVPKYRWLYQSCLAGGRT